MVDPARKDFIIQSSKLLLLRLWKARGVLFPNAAERLDIFPLEMEIVIRDFLRINYHEPIELPELTSLTQRVQTFETFGIMERENGGCKITVPQSLPEPWRRFTAAHEVAHYLLHPDVRHHRDRPLTGAERANLSLPPEEQEANIFAAYLLMPRKVLSDYFHRAFGAPIDGKEPNEELAFWLSSSTGQAIDSIELAKRGKDYRALLISQASSYHGRRFVSLADRFGVSPSAMGYQLTDLRLVI